MQRVREAAVSLAGDEVARIGPGLLVLLGVAADDTVEAAERLATKVAGLRIFENEAGRFDRSVLDERGAALVVSQFTLIAATRKGNRPSFADAAEPELAERLYARFCETLRDLLGVLARNAEEDEQARSDPRDRLPADRNRGLPDALHDCAHAGYSSSSSGFRGRIERASLMCGVASLRLPWLTSARPSA